MSMGEWSLRCKVESTGDEMREEGQGQTVPALSSQGKKLKFYCRFKRKSAEFPAEETHILP